ncbi:MAG: leucine-rich repeat domain-containing protein [Spirochaetaceae bacterium]|jgi:lactocepin|nr:leucine-rich repeat domain-containing protein [Spirochaetaceae bacterium]
MDESLNEELLIEGTVLVEYRGTRGNLAIPEGITEVGRHAFYQKPLYTVKLPKGLTTIGELAFAGTRLSALEFPEELTSIGRGAFAHTQLRGVQFPPTLNHIGNGAFTGTQLRRVHLTAGIKTLGYMSLDIETLKIITVDPENQDFIVVNGVLFDKAQTRIHTYPRGKTGSHYTVPSGVTIIGDYAFYGALLSTLDFPEGLTTIGAGAFAWSHLSEVQLPPGLVTVGDKAFAWTMQLTAVELSSRTEVAPSAFENSPQVHLNLR